MTNNYWGTDDPEVSARLSARASAAARKLQDGLVVAGFARASFVEIDRQGSVRR